MKITDLYLRNKSKLIHTKHFILCLPLHALLIQAYYKKITRSIINSEEIFIYDNTLYRKIYYIDDSTPGISIIEISNE
jgi:hypothetical protein